MRHNQLELESSFVHKYDCHVLAEIPVTALRHYYFGGETTEGGRDGLMVQVDPSSSQPWLGTFAFGDLSPKGNSGIYSWPDPETLCVVSKGKGYLADVNEPNSYETIGVSPILNVIPVPKREIVVFANYTELIAYGKKERVWATDRLSWDDLKLTTTTDDYIEGEVWDPRVEEKVRFRVNLSDGSHEGGSYELNEL